MLSFFNSFKLEMLSPQLLDSAFGISVAILISGTSSFNAYFSIKELMVVSGYTGN
jgi:hypothetical protein